LPSGVTLTGSHNARATFSNNTQADWTGPQSLTTDSAGGVLAAGSYKIWIVVTDVGGHTATAQSPAFTVTAE
jgi:hypothetical protein